LVLYKLVLAESNSADWSVQMNAYERWVKMINNIPDKSQYYTLYEFRMDDVFYSHVFNDTYRPSYRKGTKRYDPSSVEAEGIKVFIENIVRIKKDYKEEFTDTVKYDQQRLFFHLLEDWIDGKKDRNTTAIKSLKKDIFVYMLNEYPTLSKEHIFCEENVSKYKSGGLNVDTIRNIIELNTKYLEEYYSLIVAHGTIDLDARDFMLHRGLSVKNGRTLETKEYKEKKFLTSYSLSLSLAEQFALLGYNDHVLISGGLELFDSRIIASSLLHDSLLNLQLECLAIPHWRIFELKYNTFFDGVYDYTLQLPEDYRGLY